MKRIVSVLICFIYILSCFPSFVMAADAGFDASLNANKIILLESVGILEANDAFSSSNKMYVTKGEFSRMLIRLIGMAEEVAFLSKAESSYQDVSDNHMYQKEIFLATELGLFGDSKADWFYPDDTAKKTWAAEALVRLLGYGVNNSNILKTVYDLDLLDEVSASEKLRRDDALQLMVNALEVNVNVMSGVEKGDIVFESKKGATLLSEYFGIYTEEDVMLANFHTALTGERTESGYVRFGDTVYFSNNLEIVNLVGRNVKFCYKTNDTGVPEILYIEKLENKEVVLYGKDAVYNYANNLYTVDIGGKNQKFKMELGTYVSYNGSPYFSKDLMETATGHITLIDNDNDNSYDVCIIENYKNIIVSAADAEREIIFDKFDRRINVTDYDEFLLYSEKNKLIDLSELRSDKVLTLYESPDGKFARAYVSSRSFSMEIEAFDKYENKLTADGEEYVISADLRMNRNELILGERYLFYINWWNEIVYAAPDWNYSSFYLMEAGNSNRGLKSEIIVKGLAASGEVETRKLSEKVNIITYDGGRKKVNIYDTEAYSNYLCSGGVVNRRLLKIALKADGSIKDIVIPYEADTIAMMEAMVGEYPLIHMGYIINDWPEELRKTDAAKATRESHVNLWVHFAAGAKELIVPLNGNNDYSDENVRQKNAKHERSTGEVEIAGYDVYKSSVDGIGADFLITDISTAKPDSYTYSHYLVTSVKYVYDEASDAALPKLTVTADGKSTAEYLVEDPKLVTKESLIADTVNDGVSAESMNDKWPAGKTTVEAGDIIAGELSDEGKISSMRLVFDARNKKDLSPKQGEVISGETNIIKGTIQKINGSLAQMMLDTEYRGGFSVNISLPSRIVEYDMRTREAKALTAQSIQPGDSVVMYWRYGSCNLAVIYRD